MRQNRNAGIGVFLQESQNQFVNERCFPGAAGSANADDALPLIELLIRFPFHSFAGWGHFSDRRFGQNPRESMIGMRADRRFGWRRAAPVLPDEFDHLLQRRSRKKNAAHAFFAHDAFIVAGDRPAAAAKEADVGRAIVAQSIDHLRKEFDMAAVVAGDADRPHILLHRRPRNVATER